MSILLENVVSTYIDMTKIVSKRKLIGISISFLNSAVAHSLITEVSFFP